MQRAPLRKRYALQGRIEEGVFGNIFHTCRDDDRFEVAARKGIRLDARERFRQKDARYGRVVEGIAADGDDVPAQIERRQIQFRCRAVVFDHGDAAAVEHGIRPVAARNDVPHADVISQNTGVPIFLQIQRQSVAYKVNVEFFRAVEGIPSDIFDRFGQIEAGERGTTVEGVPSDVFHGGRKRDVGQFFIVTESIIVDVRDFCVAEIHALQIAHAFQPVRLNARERAALFKRDRAQRIAAFEHIGGNARQRAVFGKSDARETITADERLLRDRRDACRHAERRQPRFSECGKTDARQRAVFRKRNV